jgi:hypothetical protein
MGRNIEGCESLSRVDEVILLIDFSIKIPAIETKRRNISVKCLGNEEKSRNFHNEGTR